MSSAGKIHIRCVPEPGIRQEEAPIDELVFFYPVGHQAHFEPEHPERPDRVEAICVALQAGGWWNTFPHLEPYQLTAELLQRIHTPAYLERLQKASYSGEYLDPDTYTTPQSWQLALNAAGGALSVAKAVWQLEAKRGFALTRPPGHHARPGQGMGFCLLNNVAIAADFLVWQGAAQRLAIVDLDLHHGNGVQEIFWRRGDVFYFSTHQSPLYPGTGWLKEIGDGPGAGCTANFPMPPGSGDQAFRAIMDGLILPLIERFKPQMILASVGFDAHWRDPLGHLFLSAGVYGELIASLAAWADTNCQGRLALFLEGGYDLQASAVCAQAVTAALLGQTWDDSLGPAPCKEGNSWKSMVSQAKELWRL